MSIMNQMEESTVPNRKNELSLMNVILCLFVIFIHAASNAVTYADRASLQYALLFPVWKLASCAVPGFFFLAGVKLALGLEKPFSYPKYLLGRLKRVVLPYIAAAVIFELYFCVSGIGQSGNFFALLLSGNLEAHFYFVITIVQFYLTAPVWRLLAKKLDSGVRVAAALVIAYFLSLIFGQYLADFLILFDNSRVFPYCDRIFTTYLFWWVAGLAAGRYYDKVRAEALRSFIPALVIFLPAAILDGWLAYIHTAKKAGIWWLETAHTFDVVTAIIFLFALCTKLADSSVVKLALPLDRVSYQVYLFHPLFLYFADELCKRPGVSILFSLIVRLLFGGVVTIGVFIAADKVATALKRRSHRESSRSPS